MKTTAILRGECATGPPQADCQCVTDRGTGGQAARGTRWTSAGNNYASTTPWMGRVAPHHVILGAVVALSLTGYAYTTARYGYAAAVRTVDPILYYLPAHSWYFDGDCDFRNNILSAPKLEHRRDYANHVSKNGRTISFHPVAWSVVAMPFLVVADGVTVVHNAVLNDTIPRDGYSIYYRCIVPLAHVLLGIAGLLAIYSIASRFFSRTIAAISVAVIWCGTNVGYFISVEPTMSHSASMAFVTLAIWMSLRIRQSGWTLQRAVALGVFGGMMGATRYYNVVWTIVPAGVLLPGICAAWRSRSQLLPREFACLLLAVLCAFVCFVPQLLVNLANEGHVIGSVGAYAPVPGNSWERMWAGGLTELGSIALYPLMFVGLLGVCMVAWRRRSNSLPWLLMGAFVLHVGIYSLSPVPGYSRRYVTCGIVFAMGIGAVLHWAKRTAARQVAIAIVVGFLCFRNIALMVLVDQGIVPRAVINDVSGQTPPLLAGLKDLLTHLFA